MVSQLSHFCLGLVEDSFFLLFLVFKVQSFGLLTNLKGKAFQKKKKQYSTILFYYNKKMAAFFVTDRFQSLSVL